MRVAFDSNILAYAEGVNPDTERHDAARTLVATIPSEMVVIPVQCLGELFNVLVKKAKRPRELAVSSLHLWQQQYAIADTTAASFDRGVELAVQHRLSIWDAVIVAVAAGAGCRLLLSEDMQDGFAWGGLTVVNPFAAAPHPLLRRLLAG